MDRDTLEDILYIAVPGIYQSFGLGVAVGCNWASAIKRAEYGFG